MPEVRSFADCGLAYVTICRIPEWHRKHGPWSKVWPRWAEYPWLQGEGCECFRKRLFEAPRDVENGWKVTFDYFNTPALQERVLDIPQLKIDILWSMVVAMAMAHCKVDIHAEAP